jgi:hypothetical protein
MTKPANADAFRMVLLTGELIASLPERHFLNPELSLEYRWGSEELRHLQESGSLLIPLKIVIPGDGCGNANHMLDTHNLEVQQDRTGIPGL